MKNLSFMESLSLFQIPTSLDLATLPVTISEGLKFFKFILFFLEVYLLYNIVLVLTVQRNESAVCLHILPVGPLTPPCSTHLGHHIFPS